MCFHINKEKCPKALIAEKDIKVYKVLIPRVNFEKVCQLMSPYMTQVYKPRKLYKSEFGIRLQARSIYEGLHSYLTLKSAAKTDWWEVQIVGEFIVPKGSEYYFNEREIVSNQIKWTGRVWRTDRWIPFKGKVTDKMNTKCPK